VEALSVDTTLFIGCGL